MLKFRVANKWKLALVVLSFSIQGCKEVKYVPPQEQNLPSQSGNQIQDPVPVTAPTVPSGFILSAVSSTQVNLIWTDNSNNETGFKIEQATSVNGNYTTLITTNANETSYSAVGLASGTTYYFRISAVNSSGSSNYLSASATTLTPAPTVPSAPSGLTLTVVSSSQINLAWTDNSNNETGFKVERATSVNGNYTTLTTTGANVTTYSAVGLSSSTTYYFRVSAVNAAGNSSNASASASTLAPAPTVPLAPSGLSATAISTSQIDLAWTDNSGDETGFKIERSTSANSNFTTLTTTNADVKSYSAVGLASGTTYYFRVSAVNAAGASSYRSASATTLTPPPTVPAAPSAFSATAVSTSQVDLAWADMSSDETGFKVELATSVNGTYTTLTTTLANATAYSAVGLSSGTTYYFRLSAVNGAGSSSVLSASATTLTPAPTVPSAPTGFSAVAASTTQINLTWIDNSNNESGFQIDRASTVNGPFSSIYVAGANVTSYNDTGLVSGVTYYYRVSSFNAPGFSAYDSASATTTVAVTVPVAPSSLSASAQSSTQIFLTWADNSNNETGFQVLRATSSGGPFSSVYTSASNVTSYNDSGLASGVTYYYRVSAFNGAGSSSYTSASATTTATAPTAPSALNATGVSTSQIDLTWSDNSNNETGFRVQRATSLNGNYNTITTTSANATSYSVTGLSSGTTYYFRVSAVNAAGNSNSTSASATTLVAPPAAPSTLSATAISSSQINLAWSDNSNNETGFRIEKSSAFSGPYTLLTTTGANATSYSDVSLPAMQTYYYRVMSVNASGTSAATTPASATTLSSLTPNLTFYQGGLSLVGGQEKVASNLRLSFQTDGNLVLYTPGGTPLWASYSGGRSCSTGCSAVFQADGNLVLYQNGSPYWASNTQAPTSRLDVTASAPYLKISDDRYNVAIWLGTDLTSNDLIFSPGNFIMYPGSERKTSTVIVNYDINGVLSVYNSDGTLLWQSPEAPQACTVDQCLAYFQADGNLVLYGSSGGYWSTVTNNSGAQYLMFTGGEESPLVIVNVGGDVIFPF